MSAPTIQPPKAVPGDGRGEKKSSSFFSMSIGGRAVGASTGSGSKGGGSKGTAPSLGGAPRVDLLPPEVHAGKRAKSLQRGLRLGVFAVVALVVAATGGAWFLAFVAHGNLVSAQERTAELLLLQTEFAEVRDVKTNVAVAQAAQQVGVSTEIDWKSYILQLQATLPAGVAINTVDSSSASPVTDFAQSEIPLEGGRIGTLTFSASSPTLPSIPTWLNGISTMTGFVDAVPNSVNLEVDGTYTASITMHINSNAYSGRFAAKKDEPAAEPEEGGN
jgi:hypothetical protein